MTTKSKSLASLEQLWPPFHKLSRLCTTKALVLKPFRPNSPFYSKSYTEIYLYVISRTLIQSLIITYSRNQRTVLYNKSIYISTCKVVATTKQEIQWSSQAPAPLRGVSGKVTTTNAVQHRQAGDSHTTGSTATGDISVCSKNRFKSQTAIKILSSPNLHNNINTRK